MSELQKEPWIMVRDGSQFKLLAREGNAFLLIWVNDALSAEKEETLIRRGSVSAVILKELGVKFQKYTGIRGVALTGREAGDGVTLYLQKGKKKFVLEDDYTESFLNGLFSGIERFTPPKQKKKKGNWRANEQDEKLYPLMLTFGILVYLTAVVFCVGYCVTKQWPWFLGFLAVPVAAVFLDIRYPAYFSLVKRREAGTKKVSLSLAPL